MSAGLGLSEVVKLCSIIVHLDEYTRPYGSPVDLHTAHTLMCDPEVSGLLANLRKQGLIPVPRTPPTWEIEP